MQRNLDNPQLKGKIALVTGGSRGLGAAICQLFAQEGARVGVNYRLRRDKADEIVQEITDAGGEALAVGGDVAVDADVRSMVEAAVAAFGGIDLLVNNAGITFYKPFLEHSEEDWDQVLGVNLKSLFLCCRYTIPHMIAAGSGVIMNIGSCHAFATQPNCTAYAASKSGLEGFTRALALEMAPHKIRVNSLVPGAFWTDMSKDAVARLGKEEDILPLVNARLPLGRQGTAEEFARAALFLAADSGSYCTGQTYIIDGGLLAGMNL